VSVLIFHPSVAIFVQQVARSLHEVAQLDRFITTVRDDPDSFVQRFASAVARVSNRDLRAQFSRRAITEIPLACVETHPWRELLRLAAGVIDRDGRLSDIIWERTETSFDRLVARRVGCDLTGVYGFEHSSLFTFERARDLGLRIAYDVPAPESGYVNRILAEEMASLPELRTAYHQHTARHESRRIARRRQEWQLADIVLVNSNFTKSSYLAAGLDCAKVRVATLGAPPPVLCDQAFTRRSIAAPLTLLWAGTFGIRKGAHYLLDAWRKGQLGKRATLRVFGKVVLPDRLMRPLPDGIEIRGSVPRDELLRHYREADALIFPTLCDGFGMVATEAWSRGLPVFTTDRAGAADLLKPGINGRFVRAADASSIIEEVEWCHSHRAELTAMREGALASAAAWQWSDYRKLHGKLLRDAGLFSRST
jgi:glycosyltransferase involved in cell wall biosynthesis